VKDLIFSTVIGIVVALLLLTYQTSDPILIGVLSAVLVALVRLGAGIRHLVTGMERDIAETKKVRIETEKLQEELRKLQSRIHPPTQTEIEVFGNHEPLVKRLETGPERLSKGSRYQEGR
jgi:cell shape-determining protein MreC